MISETAISVVDNQHTKDQVALLDGNVVFCQSCVFNQQLNRYEDTVSVSESSRESSFYVVERIFTENGNCMLPSVPSVVDQVSSFLRQLHKTKDSCASSTH